MDKTNVDKGPRTIEIELASPSDLGLDSPPSMGDPCNQSGKTTCGPYGEVLKCVDGEWKRTYMDCR
jgi:hypothetical protein